MAEKSPAAVPAGTVAVAMVVKRAVVAAARAEVLVVAAGAEVPMAASMAASAVVVKAEGAMALRLG